MTRYADLDPELLTRAVRMARLPGVTRAEAAERFGISVGMLRRALTDYAAEARATRRRDLVLHALTDAGRRRGGPPPDLGVVASYLDYVNKDGSTADDVAAMLDALHAEGVLQVDGEGWRLAVAFP